MSSCARPLATDEQIEEFVHSILDIKDSEDKRNAINLIYRGESRITELSEMHTFLFPTFRDSQYKIVTQREKLRKGIYEELIGEMRPEDDEDIRLGNGGALPRIGSLKKEKKAYIIIGPPASGKSFFSNRISDTFGAMILDSDYAKRKLPEFYNKDNGASLVHEESSQIVFKYPPYNVLTHCLREEYNIVVPKIGNSVQGLFEDIVQPLYELGYAIYLVLIELDRFKATQRAFNRYVTTKRYVSLAMIFDVFSNDPILSYYRFVERYGKYFSGFCHFSNDVKKGDPPILVEKNGADDIVLAVLKGV